MVQSTLKDEFNYDDVFGIHIDDESIDLDKFSLTQSTRVAGLYKWQREAIETFFENEKVNRYGKHQFKTLFQCSTGSGKTFFAINLMKKIIEYHKKKYNKKCKILIIVPKNVIMEQGWFNELYNANIGLNRIGLYYGFTKEEREITITNMQNIMKFDYHKYDCIILDECHNYSTSRLKPLLEYDFKYMIGLTATLQRGDNKHWMLIKNFDYNIFNYSPKDALNDDILNPFDFTNIGVHVDVKTMDKYNFITDKLNQIYTMHGNFNSIMKKNNSIKFKMLSLINDRKQLINNYRRKFDVVAELCRRHKDNKIIIFNQFNKQSNKMYWRLIESNIKCEVYHSGLDNETREKILTRYKNDEFNVLITTKALDEGYNLPKIDVGIITAGESTKRQTIQRMGRVLRKKDTNSFLYQLYCFETFEEPQSNERAKLFKQLSNNYEEFEY